MHHFTTGANVSPTESSSNYTLREIRIFAWRASLGQGSSCCFPSLQPSQNTDMCGRASQGVGVACNGPMRPLLQLIDAFIDLMDQHASIGQGIPSFQPYTASVSEERVPLDIQCLEARP
ncbi:hypothetical protein R1flu_004400 [Riccia fluitans]|uniref:Uncharacterized protein n=1 Tax=Riccia fluitans TaxID=41844 RepID=A0ABD1YQ73_9MARC